MKSRQYFTRYAQPDGFCFFCKEQTLRRRIFFPGGVNIALCQMCETKANKDERFVIILRLLRCIKDFNAMLKRDKVEIGPPKEAGMPHLPYEEYVKLAGREALTINALKDGILREQQICVKEGPMIGA